ncbi:C2 calcium-dependent domain-containing protein 4A-like [Pseudochaenichthys georgianus]|uniref:C2 calcium-dependent domain-containing protein 4A-like n=1 Tax=Pseudochaenichthys georgianus TaxID=52239 RepID=UPI0039C457A9
MSSVGSSLRVLVLTPQRTPGFIIPSRSPLHFLSPRRSPDHRRLLSDPDEEDDDEERRHALPHAEKDLPCPSPRFLLPRPLTPRPHFMRPRPPTEASDTDLSTRAAMSLRHLEKVTTPYGFRAVLRSSPCTRRRESLFHRRHPEAPPQVVPLPQVEAPPPRPGPGPMVRSLGLSLLNELRKPAAALRARSLRRRT